MNNTIEIKGLKKRYDNYKGITCLVRNKRVIQKSEWNACLQVDQSPA